MRFRLRSLARRLLQLAIAFLVLLSLGGLLLFTVYSFFPSISIPYLSPAQKITEDTVFYRRSWREPFKYDIKVYMSQSANVTTHNATAFFESAQLLWHVQPQSLEEKYPKHRTKVNVKIPESMFDEADTRFRQLYAHVFIQRSDQFTPHPNISDPHLVRTSASIFNVYTMYTPSSRMYLMLNGTQHLNDTKYLGDTQYLGDVQYTSPQGYFAMYSPSLSWDFVLEDHTYTNETLPKVFRSWINGSPNQGSKAGTYNPPLIYRQAKGYGGMNTVPAENMPKPTGSSGRYSLPANTSYTTSIDVEFNIQGISQGWVRGEDAIMKLAEPKYEYKKTMITRHPYYYKSESNAAYGDIYSGRLGAGKPTAAASSGYTSNARPSNSDLGELEGYESEAWISMPGNVTEMVYMAYNSNLLPGYILSNASVLSVVLLIVSAPLVIALLLTALGDIATFWSREDTKWEGTSRLVVVLEVVYQCGSLAAMCMYYEVDIIGMWSWYYMVNSGRNILVPFYASLSLWVFAALYNIPLNPFKWRQRIASLRAPASSEIAKPVLVEDDDGSSTTTRAGELPRMRGRDLAASAQQEVDQLLKRWLLWLGTPSLVLYLVYTAATSRGYSRRWDLIYAAKNILYVVRTFQLVPQVMINYRTKSVAWIPITAYMCELLVNIHQILVEWAFRWPVFFSPVPAGTNWVYCFQLVVFVVQWVKYYKAKQD
ncbi:hypothetical protein GQ54DRAFT_299775 [Martensiomyces pterosporus]|nr:hypothetical protein GQ54DRAFT_299775 [Martensiomyces pterosporus]